MNQDLSIIELVKHASVVVQIVLVLLLAVSLASWSVIFGKAIGLKRLKGDNEEFDREFWAGRTLQELYQDASRASGPPSPQERIFAAGMREFLKLRERRVTDVVSLLEGSRRAMRASYQREMDVIEARLDFLGSVGSVSPYIGLFGTVWGIMNAFTGLSSMQQVTLATVAPGIAEALVATAIGLFAAIPAVLAYNNFSRDIDRIATHLESFIEEFSNILARNTQPAAGAEAARPATNVR
ncbi:MAG: protein TolQ [Leptothrix sp. (in: Bacteria)]|nr:protein TolQ [Leptothrix sp. (in: b-proteobacteria)]